MNLNQLATHASDDKLVMEAKKTNDQWIVYITPHGRGTFTLVSINTEQPRRFASLDTLHRVIDTFFLDAGVATPDIIVKS